MGDRRGKRQVRVSLKKNPEHPKPYTVTAVMGSTNTVTQTQTLKENRVGYVV